MARINQFLKQLGIILILVFALSLSWVACSRFHRESVNKETTTYSTAQTSTVSQPVVTKEEKVVKETKNTSEGGGVISTAWHFIGKVLAFPFKLIGETIELIF